MRKREGQTHMKRFVEEASRQDVVKDLEITFRHLVISGQGQIRLKEQYSERGHLS